MEAKITIVCFWWGTWHNGLQYVRALRNGFARNSTIPFRFVCFTDQPCENEDGIEFLPIPADVVKWPGNYTKTWVYNPENGLSGQILLVDLDTVIVGNVDAFLQYNGVFCGIRPFNPKHNYVDGGFVSFQHEECGWIWAEMKYKLNYWSKTHKGRERYFYAELVGNDCDLWQNILPDQLVSYKYHVRPNGNELKKGMRVVAYHGTPRPHQKTELHWMKEHWK